MVNHKRILIAVDGSSHSLDAVNYVAFQCRGLKTRVNLLYVFPMASDELICQINMDGELKRSIQEKYYEFNRQCERMAQDSIDQAKDILIELGMAPEYVSGVPRMWQLGIARDILKEARKGYDAVVVGRRGISRIEAFLMGSVSAKVVQGSHKTPVWVVGKKPASDAGSPRMLLAVDASENSRKAVEYSADFAAGNGAEVTLCHVVRRLMAGPATPAMEMAGEEIEKELQETMKEKIQVMFDTYRNILETAGVAPDKIATVCRTGSYSRAAEILDIARTGDFDTVVLGRRGISAVREFFMGRVTSKVLNGADDLSVWIVP
ncbi:MAG: universal stress protein [Deltaproteobacteria bacterium]|jgi:nucleotide-binding universal stress UspA family protein|nr:universal stress protein [Deltaproteobacteria bacterium]